ncbi:cleavage and polyadenylation specificity factor subunit 1-like [Oppia nitens]|uniref:cleavage and polyadenylation specificity factor subunit 1-like n=1 Tax=Oppia nitens TaxID=1686743 RepID=UPI0023D97BAA|nr:cleavage and polyadenylation specificity factor subunit 1-like [Oppia nitens]
MYAYCRTSHLPTHIEDSIYCNFYNNYENNLVTIGSTQLKVYRLVTENEVNNETTKDEQKDEVVVIGRDASRVRLECMQSFTVFGNIESIAKVSFVGSQRDSILLAFRSAKLSIVEYDPNTHDLKTTSLHYFEEQEMRGGFTQFSMPPVVRCDPEGRCAALLLYSKNIMILPFRKDIATGDDHKNISTVSFPVGGTASKSPVMASYKLDLNSEQYGEKVNNILDIQFLHNYYEPTLLILYEPVRTWAGRVAVRQDTCAMLVLSLDVHQRVHPHIWSMNHLPYDCFKAMPVPKPIGGVLIFANNSLIHLNQGLPPYGVSLNCFTEGNTSFLLKTQEDVKISLDASKACFISNDKLVISLRTGELYVLSLSNDMTRSIRGFHFDRCAASVLSTSITLCENGYIFLGSRLGNSILVHYSERPYDEIQSKPVIDEIADSTVEEPNLDTKSPCDDQSEQNNDKQDDDKDKSDEPIDEFGEPLNKKIKIEENDVPVDPEKDNIGNWFAGDVALIEDKDLFEAYGKQETLQNKKETPTTFVFEVCDSLINISPCGQICMGEPQMLAEEFSSGKEPDLELVTTSGFAKNGALSVLQRTIRPQIVTTFELPGCTDMWTVYGPNSQSTKDNTNDSKTDTNLMHAYLIISRIDATLVLQTGQEINELDQSGFSSQTSTIFAGNLGSNQYILQVSPMGVRLLDGVRELQHFPIDVGSPICYTSLADPYAVLMSQNGVIILLCLKHEAGSNARLIISRPELSTAKSKIVTICVYKDTSGLFTTKSETQTDTTKANTSPSTVPKSSTTVAAQLSALPNATTVDEEDELLYGDYSIDNTIKTAEVNDVPTTSESDECKLQEVKSQEPTYWLFIVRENGVLEIYSLPTFKITFLVKNFPMAPKVLVDSVQSTDYTGSQQQQDLPSSMPITREILITGMGAKESRPMLFARFDDELLIYEAFPYNETQVDNHLKLRFKKFTNHNILVNEPKFCRNTNQNDSNETEKNCSLPTTKMWLRCFQDISGYSGVFLCSPYPHWFIMTFRGELRIHEMTIDGSVTCFAPFHNVNCQKGFLYFNSKEELRICALGTHLSYDANWPVRKVPLRCTPHFINYHVDSKTYCLVTSVLEEVTKIVRIGGEEKDYDFLERDNRYIYPKTERFSIQLISPVNWDIIPQTKVELEEWEHVTCLKNVMLASEGTESGLKGYIAFGTNYNYGEDVTNRGRIWILDIIEVVPEPGMPLTKNKIKIVYCKEQKGPVTTLCQVKGFLLTAIGQKLYIWQLKESSLIGIAFIDTQIYIHSAISIKNLVLIADIYKSISILRYQEETRTLSLVSKDCRSLQVYSCDYAVDGSQMCFAVSDSEKNIILYSYQPEVRESMGGTRLLRRADYYFGSVINSFFRIQCKVPVNIKDKRVKQQLQTRQITMFATLDGSLGYLLPISEKTYRRLLMLQNVLTISLQHTAGLNPKAFRMIKISRPELTNPCKNILDGDLLTKFATLSMNEKSDLAKKIGTTPSQVMDDLQEIDRVVAYF